MAACKEYCHATERPMKEKHEFQLGSHFSSDITYEYSKDLDTKLHKFWIMWNFRTYLYQSQTELRKMISYTRFRLTEKG
jgi:hypothetical protein